MLKKIKKIKKAQFDLLPVIISLIFVFFLMILGLITYFNYWKGKIIEHQQYIRKIAYYSLGEQIISLPELNCGNLESIYGCLDLYKIKSFNELLEDPFYNKSLRGILFKHGQKKVVIEVIFDKESNIPCSLEDLDDVFYSNYDCGYFVLYNQTRWDFLYFTQKDVINFPILIRYRSSDLYKGFEYKLALLKIISYY